MADIFTDHFWTLDQFKEFVIFSWHIIMDYVLKFKSGQNLNHVIVIPDIEVEGRYVKGRGELWKSCGERRKL